MPEVAVSGANGFLGWHVRCAAKSQAISTKSFKVGTGYDPSEALAAIESSDSVLHIAGVNRGTDSEVVEGNLAFASQLSESLLACNTPPQALVFANSTQSTNGSTYGEAKLRASEILANTANKLGIEFLDIRIPNVFGEHGKPFYNAVTSTFCHQIASGEQPHVEMNKELTLVHAQDVADRILRHTTDSEFQRTFNAINVRDLKAAIADLATTYEQGDIPDISNAFERNLFNTYRSYVFDRRPQIQLKRNEDNRGAFFEIIRSHGGQGQSSFSTTVPGITRGNHFHRRKIERFTILSGRGTIRLRKLFTDQVLDFELTGTAPTAIDMPTMWTHSITNSGKDELLTSFWSNEIYDQANPDTIPEKVIL